MARKPVPSRSFRTEGERRKAKVSSAQPNSTRTLPSPDSSLSIHLTVPRTSWKGRLTLDKSRPKIPRLTWEGVTSTAEKKEGGRGQLCLEKRSVFPRSKLNPRTEKNKMLSPSSLLCRRDKMKRSLTQSIMSSRRVRVPRGNEEKGQRTRWTRRGLALLAAGAERALELVEGGEDSSLVCSLQ